MLGHEGEADHIADVMGDQIDLPDLQRIEHTGNVIALRLLVIPAHRPRREPHAAQIGHDHRVIARKVRRQRRPHVAGFTIAMQQNDSRPAPADTHMQRGGVGGDILNLAGRRERQDPGVSRSGGQQGDQAGGEHA
jgi:hypothetical protein